MREGAENTSDNNFFDILGKRLRSVKDSIDTHIDTHVVREALQSLDQYMDNNPLAASAAKHTPYQRSEDKSEWNDVDRNAFFSAVANIKAQLGIGKTSDGNYNGAYTPDIGQDIAKEISNRPDILKIFGKTDEIANRNVRLLINSADNLYNRGILNGGVDPTTITASPLVGIDLNGYIENTVQMVFQMIREAFPDLAKILQPLFDNIGGGEAIPIAEEFNNHALGEQSKQILLNRILDGSSNVSAHNVSSSESLGKASVISQIFESVSGLPGTILQAFNASSHHLSPKEFYIKNASSDIGGRSPSQNDVPFSPSLASVHQPGMNA